MVRYGHSLLVDRAAFAKRLQAAIDRNGLTYEEIARRARQHLPASERLSSVSVWQYAKAKSFPRRMSYIEALGKVLGVEPQDLLAEHGQEQRDDQRPFPAGSQVRLTDLGDGRATLTVQTDVPWPTALKVLDILVNSSWGEQT